MAADGPAETNGSDKVLQLTQQLKAVREQLDKKSDECEELEERLRSAGQEEPRSPEPQATKQLKDARKELEKKSDLCDELAEQLRQLEEELEARNTELWEARASLSAAKAELRKAEHAGAVEQKQQEEQLAALQERCDIAEALTSPSATRASPSPLIRDTTDQQQEVASLERRLASEKAAYGRLQEAHVALEAKLEEQASAHAERLKAAEAASRKAALELRDLQREAQGWKEREEGLKRALAHEKEMHDGVLELLEGHKGALDNDMEQLSEQLERKEDEIMNIQFEMVGLQNNLQDHVRLLAENSEELTKGKEQLAERDGRLQQAMKRQEELVLQMNEATSKLQEKVAQLSRELESSRAAYQTLEQHTQAVIGRLEGERETLLMEVSHARAEADGRVDATQAQILRLEAEKKAQAGELASSLEGLSAARAELEELRAQLLAAQEAQKGREEHLRSLEATQAAELKRVAEECGGEAARRSELLVAEEASRAEAQRERDEALGQLLDLQEHLKAQRLRESSLAEAARLEAQRVWELSERLKAQQERQQGLEIKARDMERALERSRLKERQALERAQELRTSLALLREFGREDFMNGAVPQLAGEEPVASTNSQPRRDPVDARLGAEVPSVLISVELDLGRGKVALSVAPWQTRADFEQVVEEFLKKNRLKAVFAEALVHYLEELEAQATSFPVVVQADLAEVYSTHG